MIKQAYVLAGQDPDFVATDDCTVVLRYLPDAPIWVVHGDERNMKVTEPIDVYLADKLFQLTSSDVPGPRHGGRVPRRPRPARPWWSSAAATASAPTSPRSRRGLGADVFTFSRSSTNTHVERREDIAAAARAGHRGDRPGRLRRQHRRGAAARRPPRDQRGDDLRRDRDQLPGAGLHRPGVLPPPEGQTQGSLTLFTSSSYTRGRSGYSLYSSAKAATVNLTQALADEWAADRVRVNCINPERTGTPMRTKAFGEEPAGSLLESEVVARTSLDVMISDADRAHHRRPQGRPVGVDTVPADLA